MISMNWLLLAVPGLPLLLAVPALRHRVPWPTSVALLPAVALVLAPMTLTLTMPWALFGDAGLAVDATARWWLAMSIVPWIAAAHYPRLMGMLPSDDGRENTWLLLCMAGQTGALLATDMATFFAFSSMMGYAFCGLLVSGACAASRRAARIYLVLLVLADIFLFEALLTAAWATNDHRFGGAAQIASSPSAGLYLYTAMIGFALKAGFWPLHAWLPLAYRSARSTAALLVWVAPVATGLLGMVRWLPLGEMAEPVAGMLLQGAGIGPILFAMLFGLRQTRPSQPVPYAIIVIAGAIAVILGAGLTDPDFWDRYGRWLPFVIAVIGWGLTAATLGILGSARGRPAPLEDRAQSDDEVVWIERWLRYGSQWAHRIGNESLPGLCAVWLVGWRRFWATKGPHIQLGALEHGLRRWTLAIALFLILAILVMLSGVLLSIV